MGCIPSKEQSQPAVDRSTDSTTSKKTPPQDRQVSEGNRPPQSGENTTPVDFILNLTDYKPLDASDVKNLSATKSEIHKIRKFAQEFLDTIDADAGGTGDAPSTDEHKEDDKAIRHALYDKQDISSFKWDSYEKTTAIRDLIYDAIKPNVLFEHDTKDEIKQIIDVFMPKKYNKGEVVIKQGDVGSEFYVVERGELSIHVTMRGEDGGDDEPSEVKVGDYSKGSAFGELALIFGSPRAATVTAVSDCKLWSIDRLAYRSVIQKLRFDQHVEKKKFIQTCVVRGRAFTEIFAPSQIEDLTIATKVDTYEEGEVILREGEMGDTLYIVRDGTVETFLKDKKTSTDNSRIQGKKYGTIETKMAFGTTSLLKNIPSPYTYKAASSVTVYYIMRADFEEIMGTFQDAWDGNTVTRETIRSQSRMSLGTFRTSDTSDQRYELELDQLDFYNVLGRGAFGQVRLVKAKKIKKVFALKAQSKHVIIKKGQKDHVLNEFRITKEIEHPNIIGVHCAMQDKQYLYFLLDLLPGGELMTYLVKKTRMGKGFTEDVTRFYAASVVRAFEVLHPLMIAYRDLKPENIVLNKKGYGVVVDFGLAKEVDEGQTYTFCGTPDYLAPEIIRGTGHDWAVDCWGLGVFLFEMTNGTAPFYATNQARRQWKILKGFELVKLPPHFSSGLSDLISKLLIADPSKRLGRTQVGMQGIINHRWFAGFDWASFDGQGIDAPIKPKIPGDITTIGKKPKPQDEAPETDWEPDLKNLKEWL